MGTVIQLFADNTESVAKPNGCSSLRSAIRNMEEALAEQAEVFAEYKDTTERLYKNIKSIEMNYILFGQALENAQCNTLRLRKKSARLESIMNDLQYQNNKRLMA
jgi:ERCC4-related helicase